MWRHFRRIINDMTVTKLGQFSGEEFKELLEFFKRWAPDHPELSKGLITKWQNGDHFISRYKGKIVGYITQIPQIFKYGLTQSKSGIENIGWGVTLILDMSELGKQPSLVRAAITHELLSKCENNPPLIHCGVGMIPEILKTYQRRGMILRDDCLNMYARFIKPKKALAFLKQKSYLSYPFGILNYLFPIKINDGGKNIFEISRFDEEFDSTWDSILSKKYELYGMRNAEYLNYKISQPEKNYHIYLHEHGGYVIFRYAEHLTKDLKIVKICDLVGDNRIRYELLKVPLYFAVKNGAYAVVSISSKCDSTLYRSVGMYVKKTYLLALRPPITAKMHVTFFDADLDNLW